MKNFIELYKVLEGHTDEETLSYLIYDHQHEITDKAQEIRHNKSTRAAALKSYIKTVGSLRQDEENGIYCDGKTALSIACKVSKYDETAPGFKPIMEVIKSGRKPATLRDSITYAIASARVNGWKQGDTDHYIRVGEAYYNLSLVAKVFNCIADTKSYNECDIEQTINGDKSIIMMRTRYGIGIVLPFIPQTLAGCYDVTPGEGTFEKLIKRHEERIREAA